MTKLSKGLMISLALIVASPSLAAQKLTWAECLNQAAQNHPDLISAKEGIEQSKSARRIVSSALWPQAEVGVGISRSYANNPRTDSKSQGTTYSYDVSGSQLVFDGFKTTSDVKASQEDIKASQFNYQFISTQVRSRLRSAFVNLLEAQEAVKLTQNIYELRKQSVDLIKLRYNSGTEHKGALLTAQANLSQASFEIHQADRNVMVAGRELLKEMGSETIEPIEVVATFDISQSYTNPPDFESIVHENPELLKLNAQRNAAGYDIKSSLGSLWPSLSVVGGAGRSDQSWPPRARNADVGLRVSLPILEGGARGARIDQAKSVVRDLQAQQKSLKDGLVVNLERAWASLQDAIEQVGVQRSFLEASEERSKISQQQYSVGLITYDNWTIIQDDLVRTKKTFLTTQANALLAEANWIEAQGRTLEYAN